MSSTSILAPARAGVAILVTGQVGRPRFRSFIGEYLHNRPAGRRCHCTPVPQRGRVIKALADKVVDAIKAMIDDTTQGLHVIATGSQACETSTARRKCASTTEGMNLRSGHCDRGTMFPAYGAQRVHMPFGSVYTSLQTGAGGRREQHQCLPRQQALRGGAHAVDHRARGQQCAALYQRCCGKASADQKQG